MNKTTKLPSLLSNLSEMHQALDRFFEPSWFERENWLTNVASTNWVPTIDLKDDGNQYVIRADVPGVDPKNIEISIEKGVLTIKGKKETETKEEKENYIHIERSQGSFYRAITLPNITDSSRVVAKTKNGMLEIIIPKLKESAAHKIQIKEE